MRYSKKQKLSELPELEKRAALEAIKKTVVYYMDQHWSWSYSCATAAAQGLFQKNDVIQALQKEPDMEALRKKYASAKRFDKRKFLFGAEASKDILKMLEELEAKK